MSMLAAFPPKKKKNVSNNLLNILKYSRISSQSELFLTFNLSVSTMHSSVKDVYVYVVDFLVLTLFVILNPPV